MQPPPNVPPVSPSGDSPSKSPSKQGSQGAGKQEGTTPKVSPPTGEPGAPTRNLTKAEVNAEVQRLENELRHYGLTRDDIEVIPIINPDGVGYRVQPRIPLEDLNRLLAPLGGRGTVTIKPIGAPGAYGKAYEVIIKDQNGNIVSRRVVKIPHAEDLAKRALEHEGRMYEVTDQLAAQLERDYPDPSKRPPMNVVQGVNRGPNSLDMPHLGDVRPFRDEFRRFQVPCNNKAAMDRFKKMAHELCGTLQTLNKHGIAHRDAHPGNILVGGPPDNKITIIDLGLAASRNPPLHPPVGQARPVGGQEDLTYCLDALKMATNLPGGNPYLQELFTMPVKRPRSYEDLFSALSKIPVNCPPGALPGGPRRNQAPKPLDHLFALIAAQQHERKAIRPRMEAGWAR